MRRKDGEDETGRRKTWRGGERKEKLTSRLALASRMVLSPNRTVTGTRRPGPGEDVSGGEGEEGYCTLMKRRATRWGGNNQGRGEGGGGERSRKTRKEVIYHDDGCERTSCKHHPSSQRERLARQKRRLLHNVLGSVGGGAPPYGAHLQVTP
eukprot:763060-Hanusia_phi.AAC.1